MVLRPQPKPADRRDFARFEKGTRHWLARFGLTDWHVEVDAPKERYDERTAGIALGVPNRRAIISWYGAPPGDALRTRSTPEELALHEVLHLVLADLTYVAGQKGDRHDDAIREEHRLIERLIPVLLGEEGK